MKYFRKDWILFQEIANEGGKYPSDLLESKPKSDDPETNKHVPFIIETTNGYKVRTGKNEMHPTDEKHHIMFIELMIDNKFVFRKNISLNEEPIANFECRKGKVVKAVGFCNLHGLFEFTL